MENSNIFLSLTNDKLYNFIFHLFHFHLYGLGIIFKKEDDGLFKN